jgi:FlaA1/EpsC-like NDP-sugar epimerase
MFGDRSIPRWIIFLFDVSMSGLAFWVAYLLRFDFDIPYWELDNFQSTLPLVIGVHALAFIISKSYTGIIRYTGTEDAKRIFLTLVAASAVMSAINGYTWFTEQSFIIPFGIIIISFGIAGFFMTSFRLMVKILYQQMSDASKESQSIIIYGAGEAGMVTKRTLERDAGTRYKVAAFVDDDPKLSSMKLEGIRILKPGKPFEDILATGAIDSLIISIMDLPVNRKQEIAELCLKHDVKVLNVPPVSSWINGELSFNQMRAIKIEDLLERDPIKLDEKKIKEQVSGKVVLVTGAAGSIGSEIARQLINYNPAKLVLLDMAESPSYELDVEFQHKSKDYEIVIGDVRNEERMRNVFDTFKPEVVYHAAAYKHVPLMENNPSESILVNIMGSKLMADLSVEYGVSKFVLVSSDKAVNPTNVMGASKRIAEIYVQALDAKLVADGEDSTRFITTRFGNVLGSNGSVIPFFRRQIEQGGPVTVTHEDVTRFFMTIPEACQLVLEAGAMGAGGEIFIFDMGESVKIVDLAKKMIKLSGLELGKDIQIVFTGLRPGEKLYEELLTADENTQSTHHKKIMIATVRQSEFNEISTQISDLIALFDSQDNMKIVGKMKQIVPEFVSKNSLYEKLDVSQAQA